MTSEKKLEKLRQKAAIAGQLALSSKTDPDVQAKWAGVKVCTRCHVTKAKCPGGNPLKCLPCPSFGECACPYEPFLQRKHPKEFKAWKAQAIYEAHKKV